MPVDYDSLDSLTQALQGQDAVVSTLGNAALGAQHLLVEAAVKAHVKRFIPSEFGSDTLHPKTSALPVFKAKVSVQGALKKEAESGGMTYTLICTGPFFDWGVMVGFLMNLKEKSITLFDGGDRSFSTTNLSTIGKTVAAVLAHPEETKNRAVYVQDTAISLKKLAAMGKKATGGADGWKEKVVPIDDCLANGWAELKKEKPSPFVIAHEFIKVSIWGEDYGTPFAKLDNELLGIKELSDAEVQEVVNKQVK